MFSAENHPRIVSVLLFIAFLALYTATLQQHVSTADNAEFQLVATELGLAHPPGFPLYTLLAGAVARVPFSAEPHLKINFLSAITSSLTLLLVYLTSVRLSKNAFTSAVATIALGLSTTFWQQAVYANIRSLTAFFAALCIWSLVRWRQSESENKRRQAAIIFAIALGFGFTHHLSLAFMGLVMVLWLLILDWRSWRWLPFGLIGLLPWLYLPFTAPELRAISPFLEYALGLGFGGDFFYFISPTDLLARASVMLNVLTFQLEQAWLWLAVGGLVLFWRVDRAITILLIGTFALHTFVTATYRAPQTVEYMLPAYVSLAIAIALIGPLLHKVELRSMRILLQIGLIVLICIQFLTRIDSFQALAADASAEKRVSEWLDATPPEGQLLSNWHWFNTIRYVQTVNQLRPDVTTRYIAPSGESYADNWVAQISSNISAEIPTLATNDWPSFQYSLPPGDSLNTATRWSNGADTSVSTFVPSRITLGDTIQIIGYTAPASLSIAEEGAVQVLWQASHDLPPASLFIHLVGADGQIYAQSDLPARKTTNQTTVTTFHLTPRWGAIPGDYQVLLGAYLADGTALLDSAENPRTQLTTIEVTTSQWPPYTRNPTRHKQPDGTMLIGHDISCSQDIPQRSYHHYETPSGEFFSQIFDGHITPYGAAFTPGCRPYVPLGHGIFWLGSTVSGQIATGQQLRLTQQFVSTRPVVHDLAVSVSLVGFGADNMTWAWQDLHDSIPAMGAIPTLKWIQGSRIADPHWVTVPSDAPAGQRIQAIVTVYDAFTNRPIPVLDERLTQQGRGIPLFDTTLR